MADRYRLPDALGGGEFEEHRRPDGSTEAPMGTVAFLVGSCLVCVALGLLTKVGPPLPPEPPPGTVLLDSDETVWHRSTNRQLAHPWLTAIAGDQDWAELQNYGPFVRLVPDPAAGVELPWTLGNWRVEAADNINTTVRVSAPMAHGTALLTPPRARDMAAALLAAADAAEGVMP